ncbi:glycosyltransferase family 4 protein [Sphingomonas sp. Tas61C01]|uniref:glycosyltransferase family 4 protein n=1 Tax=Sphingomonas sp. Tas61C01 TaxID=3458297 RepID=UPI00403E6549
MRILTVSAFYESHGGGIEIVAGAMARALAGRGHQCRWAAAGFDVAPADATIAAVPLPASDPLERLTGLPFPLPHRGAWAALEREVVAADAVIVHDALYASSQLAARFARRHRKPWLLVQHIGVIPYTNPLLRLAMGTANRLVARPLVRRAPQVVFISDLVRRYFAADVQEGRHGLLFNGVDHRLFHPPETGERPSLRRQLGIAEEPRQLLFVGRFVEKKGLATMRALAAARPDWEIRLVGGGPIDPVAWGLPNVRVLGRRSRAELAEVYRACDALVLPSVGEGFPLVVQEAMASGLQVFCGMDSAGADPAVQGMLHGVRVDPADAPGTAARFVDAIAAAPNTVQHDAAEHARRHYDWDRNAERLEQRLTQLTG